MTWNRTEFYSKPRNAGFDERAFEVETHPSQQYAPKPVSLMEPCAGRTPTSHFRLLAVPGIGLPQPEQWSQPHKLWLKTFPEHSLPSPTIYSFRHGLEVDNPKLWDDLFNQGGVLIETILQLKDQHTEVSLLTKSKPTEMTHCSYDHVLCFSSPIV